MSRCRCRTTWARRSAGRSPRRPGPLVVALALAALASTSAASTWRETFASGALDAARWQRTVDGDFREHSAEVVPRRTPGVFRLRLLADTRGSRDETVKYLGIASGCAISLRSGTRISILMDWGPPANGSYLSAGIALSPHSTSTDATATDDWLSVSYVGVPPGHNARLLVTSSARRVVRTLYADGWPDRNRAGRPIDRVELVVEWRDDVIEVRENGRLAYALDRSAAAFDSAQLYLHLASHSNYGARAVHFEDIRVTQDDGIRQTTAFPAPPKCAHPTK
jgi:hypothetical protein